MKEPIKPEDIRKGDLIRWEWRQPLPGIETAIEYTAFRDAGSYSPIVDVGQHYLLDRPTPAALLPTEPTLGWVEQDYPSLVGRRLLGVFACGENDRLSEQPAMDEFGHRGKKVNQVYRVAAFTPATAVPTEALDEFRRVFENTAGSLSEQLAAGDRFLAAVDKAANR